MPVVKLKHIVSFSSEDKVHKAENLLKVNKGNKWRCANPGESQASVVIQLEKACSINAVDIGNDGSAFVEILVARSTGEEVYKVLLVASSFMSLSESRSGSGSNRVRMFDSSKLSDDILNEKWDRVKIVCTQPFNKHTAYGLHFITFHSPEERELSITPKDKATSAEISSGEQKRTSFGAFKLKQEAPEKVPAVPSSFLHRNTVPARTDPPPINIENLKRKNAAKIKSPPEKRMKPETTPISAGKTDDRTNTSRSSNISVSTTSSSKPAKRPVPSTDARGSTGQQKPEKTKSSTPSKAKKSFNQLLDDVVFVLSGYQNPKRGEIRDKALMMGAQYRRDWGTDCTHLVCAFANTPKYHQIIGTNGFIMKDGWIYDCYNKKQRLPLKAYNLRPDYTSDDEKTETGTTSADSDDDDAYNESTDDESPDTEDEIKRIFKKRKENDSSPQDGDSDVYNESTDEETEEENNDELTSLPDYFNGQDFFLFGDFSPGVERMLKRHILTCGGSISNYMSDDVLYVVSESPWQQEFDNALGDNPSLVFVKPLWVFRCGQEKKLLPYQPFTIPTQ